MYYIEYIFILIAFSVNKEECLERVCGERRYTMVNLSNLFIYYESTLKNIWFDWIEVHHDGSKVTKGEDNSGIVKNDAIGRFCAN